MRTRCSSSLFLFAVAANVPFWVASRLFGLLVDGVFNLEFLALGVASLFLSRSWTLALLVVAIAVDILSGVAKTYLLCGSDLLRSAPSVAETFPAHLSHFVALASLVAVVLLFAAYAMASDRKPVARLHIAAITVLFALLCLGVDSATGHLLVLRPNRQWGTVRLMRLPINNLVKVQMETSAYRRMGRLGLSSPSPALAASRLLAASASAARTPGLPNIVLVLVESWGEPLNPALDQSLLRPYANPGLTERYTLSLGTVPFHGPTVSAEARELCGSSEGFGILSASAAQMKDCLPVRLAGMGYRSVAIHGFSSRMFDRRRWYGRIGFDETRFRDQLLQQGLPLCPGVFPGICDAAVSAWIGDRLQQEPGPPSFVYWVTLNSHLPVPIPNRVSSPASCSEMPATASSATLCSWYQIVSNVHRSVAQLALRPTTRPTVFLIVGDHMPPFSTTSLRSQFSERAVPYVMLMPKTGNPSLGPSRSLDLVASRTYRKEIHASRGSYLTGVAPWPAHTTAGSLHHPAEPGLCGEEVCGMQ